MGLFSSPCPPQPAKQVCPFFPDPGLLVFFWAFDTPVPTSEAPEPNTDIIYFPKPNTARRLFLSSGILQPCNLTINLTINHKHSFYCLLPQLFSLAEGLHVRYILELSPQIGSNFSTIINNAEMNILTNTSLCIYILEELLSNQRNTLT